VRWKTVLRLHPIVLKCVYGVALPLQELCVYTGALEVSEIALGWGPHQVDYIHLRRVQTSMRKFCILRADRVEVHVCDGARSGGGRKLIFSDSDASDAVVCGVSAILAPSINVTRDVLTNWHTRRLNVVLKLMYSSIMHLFMPLKG